MWIQFAGFGLQRLAAKLSQTIAIPSIDKTPVATTVPLLTQSHVHLETHKNRVLFAEKEQSTLDLTMAVSPSLLVQKTPQQKYQADIKQNVSVYQQKMILFFCFNDTHLCQSIVMLLI